MFMVIDDWLLVMDYFVVCCLLVVISWWVGILWLLVVRLEIIGY